MRTGATGVNAAAGTFSYDALGRVVQHQSCTPQDCGTVPKTLTYGYDLAGDVTGSSFGQGVEAVSTQYNAALRPLSVAASPGGALISNLAYDARGQELTATLGNGLAETRSNDGRGRPTLAQDGTVYSWTIGSYAPDGDVLASSDSVNGSWSYAMNGLNQLAEACSPACSSGEVNYTYDRFGNRWVASGGIGGTPINMSVAFPSHNQVVG